MNLIGEKKLHGSKTCIGHQVIDIDQMNQYLYSRFKGEDEGYLMFGVTTSLGENITKSVRL